MILGEGCSTLQPSPNPLSDRSLRILHLKYFGTLARVDQIDATITLRPVQDGLANLTDGQLRIQRKQLCSKVGHLRARHARAAEFHAITSR